MTETKFNPKEIEKKWQEIWSKTKLYSPDLENAPKPFYNLMMFPYPSAEGLHVGNMYAFTGTDIYGRFKRMQGNDVFEPIGLDGFGIHSENYALKIGKHPMDQAEISQKNFYRQLHEIGNSYDWDRTLETYNPNYYKWTQWLFVQMFKHGLAYRKKASVNWCPACKTVLSDEQVISGECERCGSVAEIRELEQWFFKITNYAERLLNGLNHINWPDRIKNSQKNWIGKSVGAKIKFSIKQEKETNYVFLHAYKAMPEEDFWPWLKTELEKTGAKVYAPQLPHTFEPNIEEQVDYLLKNYDFNENTVVVTHSLGGVTALKLLPKLKTKIKKLVMVTPPLKTEFLDGQKREPLEKATDWKFDFTKVKEKAFEITVIRDIEDHILPAYHPREIAENLQAKLVEVKAPKPHFNCNKAIDILNEVLNYTEVFTTRPDTLFGATFLVLSVDHPLVNDILSKKITAEDLSLDKLEEIKKYVNEVRKAIKTQKGVENPLAGEARDKTGIFTGLSAINPATNEEIPIWISDYVLMSYGSGAIMAVPAHDQRDFEFARKFGLDIKEVVAPKDDIILAKFRDKVYEPVELLEAYEGEGIVVNSGDFSWKDSETVRKEVIEWLSKKGVGEKQIHYHLRDWLISRQRYWGPPIPMIFCQTCADAGRSWFTTKEAKDYELGIKNQELGERNHNSVFNIQHSKQMAGWNPVAEQDLPVKLPYLENYKPQGTGESPLAQDKEWVNTTCPVCKGPAKRETDVSDTFLDSAWYYLRYLCTECEDVPFPSEKFLENSLPCHSEGEIRRISENQRGSFANAQDDKNIRNSKLEIRNCTQRAKWLPVNMYIGGAEHSVLHLMYVRFATMALFDWGYLKFEEPFPNFFAHGLIIKEGAKMSKSKGNIVTPDQYINTYGADTLRSYLMFLGPLTAGGDFRDSGIEGMFRFLRRVWNLFIQVQITEKEADQEVIRATHRTIKGVTEGIERFSYNTSIARLMELYNLISSKKQLGKETVETFLKLLAPFAPFMTEEIYHRFKNEDLRIKNSQDKDGKQSLRADALKSSVVNFKASDSIHFASWPVADEKLLQEEKITIVVQVNGKRRGEFEISASDIEKQEMIEKTAKETVQKYLEGKEVKKAIYVKGKIINLVI